MQYIREIDGLRAFAVLSVIAFHLDNAFLPGGFTGVDVFFVISGYVVSKAAAQRFPAGFVAFLVDFYRRRVVRIVPALLACLLVTALASALFIPESWLSQASEKTGLLAFFGLGNFALVVFNDGYFSPRIDFNPFMHTWSLGVEEQFYFLFPPLFFFWLAWRGRAGRWALLPGVVLALASLGCAWYWGQHQPVWSYYLLPSRFWELYAGALLYQWHSRRTALPTFAALPWLGLGLLLAGFWLVPPQRFPWPWALVPVLASLALIHVVVAGRGGWVQCLLGSRALVHAGKISYSLYLWHWPVFVLLRWTVGLDNAWTMAVALLVTFLAATASFQWVEAPLRHAGWLRRRPPAGVLAGGVLVAAVSAYGSIQVFGQRAGISQSVTADTQLWYPYAAAAASAAPPQPAPLRGLKVFAVGDSHTGAYTRMLDRARQELGIDYFTYSTAACPIGQLLYSVAGLPRCAEEFQRFSDWLRSQARPGDVVLFASLRVHRLSDQWGRFDVQEILGLARQATDEQVRSQVVAEHSALFAQLRGWGLRVVVDAPKPVFPAPAFRCSDWFNRTNPICREGLDFPRETLLEMRAPAMATLEAVRQQFDNVWVWDPFPILCPAGAPLCSPFDAARQPLFFDGDHLSGHGNDVLYPDFARLLLSLASEGSARP